VTVSACNVGRVIIIKPCVNINRGEYNFVFEIFLHFYSVSYCVK
jgi:hypothetical protein